MVRNTFALPIALAGRLFGRAKQGTGKASEPMVRRMAGSSVVGSTSGGDGGGMGLVT